jgi:hypothetical protein
VPSRSSAARRAAARVAGLSRPPESGHFATAIARQAVRDRIAVRLDLPDDLDPTEREVRINAAVSEHYAAMGRCGGATIRTGSRDTRTRAERLAIARADLIEHRVCQLVAAAPPLTEQQRRRIAAVLDAAPVDTYAAQQKNTTDEALGDAAEQAQRDSGDAV